MKANSFDIIIAGAGISGLLLASQLSQNFSVLVLEKNAELPSSKYWLTTSDCLIDNEFLNDCLDCNYDHMNFISHDLASYKLEGSYTLWDSEKLLNKLKKQVRLNNGVLLYSHRFYSSFINNSRIKVLANDKEFSGKLLIDCMGYASPLILAKSAMQIVGYHLLYGAVLKTKINTSPVCLANTCISNNPVYLEIFPRSDGNAYVSLIKPLSQINNIHSLKSEFDFITQQSIYSSYFENTSPINELGGIVPVGIIKSGAFDRVFFFGEAAQMNPSATGTCLTMLLKHYKVVAEFLKGKIENSRLTKSDLEKSPIVINKFSRNFQLFLFKEMLTWKSDDFAKFLTLLNHIDNNSINNFLFDQIKISDFFKRENLYSVLKSRNVMWLRPFIKSIIN